MTRPAAALTALALTLALVTVPGPGAGVQAQPGMPITVARHAGATRTATAAAVAGHTHPEGAGHVVLARADAYGDALAGAPLAAALDAPVLLTAPDVLDPDTAAEIDRLDPATVVVLGDVGEVVAAAAAEGRQLQRVRGGDQWTTWAAIALEVTRLTGADHALLVEGSHSDPQRGWPDALAASSWGAAARIPVLLTTADALPTATRDAIAAIAPARVTVVGGTAAVGPGVADQVAALGPALDRIAGTDRYATATAVAAAVLDLDPDAQGYVGSVWVASGRGWPDALVAGPAAARDGAVLVLSDPTSMQHSPATRTFLDTQRGYAASGHLVGGTAVLSEDVAHTVATGEVREAAGPAERPGDADRPPPVPARNTAPPIADAVPWSDPATWGGQVPRAGEVVTIPRDRAVLLDVDPPILRGLQVDGTLTFADRDVTLQTGWIAVTGHLAIGTPERPLTKRVTVVLDPHPGDEVSGAGEGPIAVQGGTLDVHGTAPVEAWTRLAATAVAGSTTVTLEQAPGWQVGDRVVLASTSTDPDQAEERTVTAIVGATVTLDQPLIHTHWGQTDAVGGAEVALHGEVASLSQRRAHLDPGRDRRRAGRPRDGLRRVGRPHRRSRAGRARAGRRGRPLPDPLPHDGQRLGVLGPRRGRPRQRQPLCDPARHRPRRRDRHRGL